MSIRDPKSSSEPPVDLSGQVRKLGLELEVQRAMIDELRTLLLEAHEQLLARDQEIQQLVGHALDWLGLTPPPSMLPSEHLYYLYVIRQVQEVVRELVPASGIVIVVTKGDERLVELGVRTGWHFPRSADGRYAGYYPADSAAAVEQLDALRFDGAQYFMLPKTAFWWLESYPGLRVYLEDQADGLHLGPHCRLYRLRPRPERRVW